MKKPDPRNSGRRLSEDLMPPDSITPWGWGSIYLHGIWLILVYPRRCIYFLRSKCRQTPTCCKPYSCSMERRFSLFLTSYETDTDIRIVDWHYAARRGITALATWRGASESRLGGSRPRL